MQIRIFLTILLGFFAVVPNKAVAQAVSIPCISKIAKFNSWEPVIASQLNCMAKEFEFHQSIVALCSPDHSDISAHYQKYIDHKMAYAAAFEKFRSATDLAARNLALLDLQVAEQDWNGAGFRSEIDGFLNKISQVHFHCVQ